MEDFERIQHREHQRQELLEKLKKLISGELDQQYTIDEGGNENSFYWGFVTCIALFVFGLPLSQSGGTFYLAGVHFFNFTINKEIEEFTPVPIERELIRIELLKYVIEQMAQPIHSKILRLSVPPGRDGFLRQVGLDKLE